MGLGSALDDAYRATSMLYNPEMPFNTHLWCAGKTIYEIGKEHSYYRCLNLRRAQEIYATLTDYVKTLNVQSVENFVEKDYLGKYFQARNFYFPISLRQQAEVSPWFLGGSNIPEPMMGALRTWWSDRISPKYRVLTPKEIKCPRFEASAGVCYVRTGDGYDWEYLPKGRNWGRIQDGTEEWLRLVTSVLPDTWLDAPITSLISKQCLALEALALERPVIRKESGPGKVRWARSSSGNVYILGRMFAEFAQNDAKWNKSSVYIGKSSNTVYAANRCDQGKEDDWYIGTHGDDWLAWCPQCHMWHSGDWSNFDLHVTAREMLASKQAWFDAISHLLTKEQTKWFYALAYLSIRCPSIWLWDRRGRQRLSIRRTLGKVRSGSGEFILDNNAINSSKLHYLLPLTHKQISSDLPCKTKRWWKQFSTNAVNLGWVAKPEAQFSHPFGFVACRCTHLLEDAFMPRPSVCSVMRNYVNPAYDPDEYPNNARDLLVVRFRELNKTLAWSLLGDKMMETVVNVHVDTAGVKDPYGDDLSDADLSRAISRIVDQYSTRSYIEGGETS